MEEGFDLDNILDSMNLTGQWQPSSTLDIFDSSLTSQILDDIVLSTDDLLPRSTLFNSDDICNALIDPPMDSFDSFIPIASNSPETDDITKLISSPIGEVPRRSTIEDTMERMNLHNTSIDSLTSSICIPTGSSPVEPKEINNTILANRCVRGQQKIIKNASKHRKSSGSHTSSSTVGPIDVLSSYSGCQPCTTLQMQNDFDYENDVLEFDSMESKKIQIISQPRSKFRPRTQNESKSASHYLRCEDNSRYEYPTIMIPYTWARQSVKNIIEVTLVTKDGESHPYAIDNKNTKTLFDDDAVIFRRNELNTLYFCVTDEDFKNGYKSFMIEYIKSKQDERITKDVIRTQQLDLSMLRFKRYFQAEKNTYECDEGSVEYSCLMTEAYGDVSIEHMGPRFGPMCGNEGVYCLLKGRVVKDDITVFVSEETTGWCQQISFTKNGNLVYFTMPAFPHSQFNRAETVILIKYKRECLHQLTYVYKGDLDEELAALNINDSPNNFGQSSTLNTYNPLDFFSSTTACPVSLSSRKSSTTKRTTKRLNNNK